jgi:hypothetical protein
MARRTRSRFLEGDDLDDLIADLDDRWMRIQHDAKPIVEIAAQRAGMEMIVRIPRDTGRTASSVTWDESATVKGNEVSAEAGPEWFVARFIEYGTSKMPPRSFAEPAALAATPKFLTDLLDAGDLTKKRRTRK